MLLAIDIGNTNVVFAVYDGDRRCGQWRLATDPQRTADEYASLLDVLFQRADVGFGDISAVIAASVVPPVTPNVARMCANYLQAPFRQVGDPALDLGIEVLIDQPETVGADRLVNAVAGHKLYDGALLLIDFGTATTFDIVDAGGNYRGGVFAPGINQSTEALYKVAAKLPRIEIKPTAQIIGRATVPAMQSGVFWGYVSMIEGLVRRIVDEFAQPMTVIATGGLAGLFNEHCAAIDKVDPDITMVGLQEIFRRNPRAFEADTA